VAAFGSEPTKSSAASGAVFPDAMGAITRAGRRPRLLPCSQSSRASAFPTVADSPTRCTGCPVSVVSRSSTASRCQPRSSPANACTSSMITARTSLIRARGSIVADTSIDPSDSGVVNKTSGRSRSIRRRTPWDVSPCRTAADRPNHDAYRSTRTSRLFSSARSGHTYSTDVPPQPSAAIRVNSGNRAASVFPPAVGASSRASSPASSGAMAASCNGRSSRHPSSLTTWCCTTGWRASKPAIRRPGRPARSRPARKPPAPRCAPRPSARSR